MGKLRQKEKGKRKKLNLKVLVLFIGAFFIVVILLTALISYSGTNIAPKSLVRASDVIITEIPFLPKPPRQVLSRAFFEMARIKSGEHDFSLQVVGDPDTSNEKKIFSVQIAGPFAESAGELNLSGKSSLDLVGTKSTTHSQINFTDISGALYFQVKNLPDYGNLRFNRLGQGWYRIDVGKIKNDAKANVLSDKDIAASIKQKAELLLGKLSAKSISQKISVLPSEEVGGRKSRHYKIVLGGGDTKGITDVFNSGLADSIKNLSLDFWVDKSKYYFNKVQIEGLVSLQRSPVANVIITSPPVGFKFGYSYNNSPAAEIAPPKSAEDVSSLTNLYLLLTSQPKNKNPLSSILDLSQNLGDFGANLLTVERLLHVLYLTPISL